MCQTLETKQEPSFVSNTFSKQVRGSWAGTQLKGISLFSNPKDFYLYLPKCHLESFVSATSQMSTAECGPSLPGSWELPTST